jgi:hypothetical protein
MENEEEKVMQHPSVPERLRAQLFRFYRGRKEPVRKQESNQQHKR